MTGKTIERAWRKGLKEQLAGASKMKFKLKKKGKSRGMEWNSSVKM